MDTDSTRWLKLKSGSDIRCREADLTDETCARIGYAFARMLAEQLNTTPDRLKIAVGCIDRAGGPRVKKALTRGITAADSDVVDAGTCPLPALFMDVSRKDNAHHIDGAVMVTGSERTAEINGFKFITANGILTGEDVTRLLRLASEETVPERLVTRADLMADYRAFLLKRAAVLLADDALKPLLGLYVVVDTTTLGGKFYADLLESMGADIERIGGIDIGAETLRFGTDFGAAFDVDCSRVWLCDAAGCPVDSNRLIATVAAMLLDKKPGQTIVTDSVTSTGLSAFIAEWGGIHYRFKRGYSNVIREAMRLNDEGIDCPLAIETTGLAAFRENGFVGDGIYLALRIACAALDCKREGKTVFDPLSDLSEPVEAKVLRLRILDEEDPAASSQEVVEIILSNTLENPEWQMAPDSREGVRITFNLDGGIKNAWFQLRMSVHDPMMVLNAESDVPGGVRRVLGELYTLIKDTELLELTPLKAALE